MDSNWLTDLRTGDPVIVRTGYVHASYALEYIQRTTATLIVLRNGLRFRRDSGDEFGALQGALPRNIEEPAHQLTN